MADSNTPNEDHKTRCKRIRYRAWHRGTQEMDMVLGHFVDAKVDEMAIADLDRLENLMDEQDTDLLKWVMGQEPTPQDVDAELVQQLIEFQMNRTKS